MTARNRGLENLVEGLPDQRDVRIVTRLDGKSVSKGEWHSPYRAVVESDYCVTITLKYCKAY